MSRSSRSRSGRGVVGVAVVVLLGLASPAAGANQGRPWQDTIDAWNKFSRAYSPTNKQIVSQWGTQSDQSTLAAAVNLCLNAQNAADEGNSAESESLYAQAAARADEVQKFAVAVEKVMPRLESRANDIVDPQHLKDLSARTKAALSRGVAKILGGLDRIKQSIGSAKFGVLAIKSRDCGGAIDWSADASLLYARGMGDVAAGFRKLNAEWKRLDGQ